MKVRILRGKVWLKRLQRFILTTVVGGLVVVLPISIFGLLVRFVFIQVLKIITPISRLLDFPDHIKVWIADLTAFGLVLLLFFLIGLLVRTEIGKRIFQFVEENLLAQLPFYMVLRETVQQLIGAKRMPFSKVVLVDVYGNATRMTGFVVDEHPATGMVTVFVPTAPNPTNGFIFHVKEDQIVHLDVRSEDAIRTVIGVGIGSSQLFEATMPKEPEPSKIIMQQQQQQ